MMRYYSSDYSTLSGKKSFSDVIKVPNQNMKTATIILEASVYDAILLFNGLNPPVPAVPNATRILSNIGVPAIINNIISVIVNAK